MSGGRLTDRNTGLLREGAWIAAGQGIAAVATLIGVRLLTELAQPSLLGAFVLLNGALALLQRMLFQPFAQAGLRFYPEFEALKQVPALRHHLSAIFRRRWLAGFVLIASAALVDVTTTRYLTLPIWVLLAAALGLEGWRTIEIVMRNAARRQASYAMLFAADSLARPTGSVIAATVLGASVQSLLLGQTLGGFVVLASFFRGASNESPDNPPKWPAAGSLEQVMARFAAPLAWTPIVGWVNGLADRYIVGALLGLGQAGVYSAAYGIASRPLLTLATVSDATVRQLLYGAVAASDRASTSKALLVWVTVNLVSGSLVAALIATFCRPLVGLLLADTYRSAAVTLIPWIAFGHVPLVIAQAVERLAYARQRTRAVTLVQAASAALSVAAAALGAAWAGLTGVAMAVPVYFTLQLLLTVWMATRPGR